MYLDELRRGDTTYDEGDSEMQTLPPDLDRAKFDRGRRFFISNVTHCLEALLCTLVCGLSVVNLLDVLVATNESDTPKKSFRRYLRTTIHLLKWHYGNVWDPRTSAGKSIRAVRRMHVSARKFMMEKRNQETDNEMQRLKTNVSQYDMSLVQSAFVGAVIMYPHKFGIRCSKSNLDDYVYFWRWIGYLLGISDENNMCCSGYERAYGICKEIEHSILIPAMMRPPKFFYPMAKAFTDGLNLLFHFPMVTPDYIMALTYEAAGYECPFKVRLSDRVRMFLFKCRSIVGYYVPFISWFLGKIIELAFRCRHMT